MWRARAPVTRGGRASCTLGRSTRKGLGRARARGRGAAAHEPTPPLQKVLPLKPSFRIDGAHLLRRPRVERGHRLLQQRRVERARKVEQLGGGGVRHGVLSNQKPLVPSLFTPALARRCRRLLKGRASERGAAAEARCRPPGGRVDRSGREAERGARARHAERGALLTASRRVERTWWCWCVSVGGGGGVEEGWRFQTRRMSEQKGGGVCVHADESGARCSGGGHRPATTAERAAGGRAGKKDTRGTAKTKRLN